MISIYRLVCNEIIKMLKKKRFLAIVLILIVLIPVFTYARFRVAEDTKAQFGTTDWRVVTEQQVKDYTNRLSSPRLSEDLRRLLNVEIVRLSYALEKDINPLSPNGVSFAREFMVNALYLFIPLMVAVVGADIVSSEHSTGSIKLLLTRPVSRWKVLLSKLLTLILFVSLIIVLTGLLAYLMSGVVFGYGGWTEPVLTGYEITNNELSTTSVYTVEQWQFMLMEYGLAWFSCTVVACLSLLVSVLVRNTATGMGIMMSTLIAGSILSSMASSWTDSKYLFMLNLQTTDFLSGSLPAVPGLTLSFSLTVLSIWAAAALIIAFTIFSKKDVLN